jgi:ATP-dependent Clp protease ATP-binding subunit ClpA
MNNQMEVLDFNDDSNEFSVLKTYGENLKDKNYITNPAIGREKEIKDTLLILLTPEKSAMLVGKPGIGKTAIVEGIGYRLQRGDVPDALKNYELIKINVSSLLGNIQSEKGVNENKLQILVNELKDKENIILFIDEVHLLVSRNTSNLNVDFANMLKPGLDRGTIKMIGATTTEEYDAYILRDRAFLRRFQKVEVLEPTMDDTVKILMGTYPKLEKQSNVTIPYSEYQKEKLFKFLVDFTDEYKRIYEIGNRYPDIALTLLGNAFSNAVFENKNVLNITHIYYALKNSKNVYEDAKRKGIIQFKEIFKDIIEEENAVLD